ncbi:MAG: hypothetical protein L0H94_05390 [Nitrospira sp.]|nr:hypothetical protein [Nitrospira sp.]
MIIIRWLYETMGALGEWLQPVKHAFVSVYRARRIDGQRWKVFYVGLIAYTMICPGVSVTGWTADLSFPDPLKSRMVVAAGVGYENVETSTITVKTYDADNGAILSEETYDLNVREDAASAGSQPRERIFAGGVGPGDDGLSAFTLRVYDAATGRFLWEGLLNLNVGNQESDSTHRVVAYLVAPQATVTQVRSRGAIEGQPQFFLRAVDFATGELMWSDQFLAGADRLARTESVSRAVAAQTEGLATPSQQIEFRIRMTDERDRQILWEDMIEPIRGETDLAAGHDDAAENLPAWRSIEIEEMNKKAI